MTFVEAYFEKLDVDRSVLPDWMRSFGVAIEEHLLSMRAQILPLLDVPDGRAQAKIMLEDWPIQAGRAILRMSDDTLAPFGLDGASLTLLAEDDAFVDSVPAAHVSGRLLTAYMRQIFGLDGSLARVEDSFGGDLIHALYLPHVDLWRGDRRVAALVAAAVPRYAARVVALRADLPEAIARWHEMRS